MNDYYLSRREKYGLRKKRNRLYFQLWLQSLTCIYLITLITSFNLRDTHSYYSDEIAYDGKIGIADDFCSDEEYAANHELLCNTRENTGEDTENSIPKEGSSDSTDKEKIENQNHSCKDSESLCDVQSKQNSEKLSKENSKTAEEQDVESFTRNEGSQATTEVFDISPDIISDSEGDSSSELLSEEEKEDE
ncbi:hypothetical protein GJU40_10655 [Bacillus lacus]|uniref:Uncharacterized protein n=1 Tax=Metabacillus lacus TaxID=1983721 RepID=A0A7X2M023_9BACI|nr:hypothetical protein [Metabacillus lacus]MRX72607.1 hypothetical protein [Metabacillus lacus]